MRAPQPQAPPRRAADSCRPSEVPIVAFDGRVQQQKQGKNKGMDKPVLLAPIEGLYPIMSTLGSNPGASSFRHIQVTPVPSTIKSSLSSYHNARSALAESRLQEGFEHISGGTPPLGAPAPRAPSSVEWRSGVLEQFGAVRDKLASRAAPGPSALPGFVNEQAMLPGMSVHQSIAKNGPQSILKTGPWSSLELSLSGDNAGPQGSSVAGTAVASQQATSSQLSHRSPLKGGLWQPAAVLADGHANTSCTTNFTPLVGSLPLVRQSSNGSYTESLFSNDLPTSILSPTTSLSTSESTLLGFSVEAISKEDATKLVKVDDFSSQSWAQQTEQRYNLQLALALRLVATAELAEEPYLVANSKESGLSSCSAQFSATSTALRFWVNGSLGYSDKIQDGFYHIWGINPHIWAICNDTKEGGGLPSLEVLRKVNSSDTPMEVVLFDKHGDSHLLDLENKARKLAYKVASLNELAESLGKLVCGLMGGAATMEDGELVSRWRASSSLLKECFSCLVIPVGSLSVGLCRHRALLYKALADCVDLPCRIIRGCKYCGLNDGASCLVLCGMQREWLVDLISNPGELSNGESFLKCLQSPPINSPLRLPDLKVADLATGAQKAEVDFEMQLSDITQLGSLDARNWREKLEAPFPLNGPASARLGSIWPIIASSAMESRSSSTKLTKPYFQVGHERKPLEGKNTSNVYEDPAFADVVGFERHLVPQKHALVANMNNEAQKQVQGFNVSLDLDGFEIPWEDLILKERIGAGSFGTVHRADWHGSDVAVKILIEQDIQEQHFQEFVREVALMKRMRHPNVVLFMGAVTKRPNFSIVTEYLPRGSLFRLLHKAGVKEMLDEKRRIRMALDVARGMNYLHRLTPPIVHRDLKSPNLLVDKPWTVKVCDFGLSRFKGNTFLSSRSAAGTPEWMAPEVLRDEPSNEKSDIYSFGVILWELVTLQQPWSGLSPAQVVGAVGFQNRRLQIPRDIKPELAVIIETCFSDDPRQRPSFANVMELLQKVIQKLSVTAPPTNT